MVPPAISITHHGATSSKMIISPPRINLRRAASYNAADRGPLSSSSSRFGFEHLAFSSPPPSPGLPLPQQAPRRRRNLSNAPRPSRVIRCLLWLSGAVLIFYLATKAIRDHGGRVVPEMLEWARSWDEKEYEMVGQDELPDFPTPIIVTDRRGRARWTVSIPPSYDFPLTTKEYFDMCEKCREVASRVRGMHSHSPAAMNQISFMAGDAGNIDKYFMDVREAEQQGFLPSSKGKGSGRGGELLGVDGNSLVEKTICKSSLTFVLESDDAGLGTTIMALWMAYGLAKREGRAFFLDDTRWAYGEFTNMFEKPAVPDCRPPPRHQMLPCPRRARHLVIGAHNARDVFAGAIDPDDMYVEGPAASLTRRPAQRELYRLARQGYEALFRLTTPDREYVFNRVMEHKLKTYSSEGPAHNGRIVGVHVRHGDRHPLEFQYADSYIPLAAYVEAAGELLNASLARGAGGPTAAAAAAGSDDAARAKSLLVLASDDPLVYDAGEFDRAPAGVVRAQDLIRLAGKAEADGGGEKKEKKPKNVMHKFTDETFGWEGGFFAAMFWNLGVSPLSAANAAASSSSTTSAAAAGGARGTLPPSPETIRLRSLVGRGYLMDLAVLVDMTAEGGGGVVCGVAASGCRLLAVMMGEERAFGRGEWRNVDGDFGWHGFTW